MFFDKPCVQSITTEYINGIRVEVAKCKRFVLVGCHGPGVSSATLTFCRPIQKVLLPSRISYTADSECAKGKINSKSKFTRLYLCESLLFFFTKCIKTSNKLS
jgi:ligand-binding sensor protein